MADDQTPFPAPLARFRGETPEAPRWFQQAIAQAPERRRIPVSGAGIELLTWGEIGKPGLLFLHGNGAHADWWSFIAPFFAADWRVAAISWSGMGGSDWRPEYSGAVFAEEIFAAAEAAGLEAGGARPVVVGNSFGGFPLMYAAAHHPERLRAAVLVDSSVQPPEKRWRGPPQRLRPNNVYPTLEEALARFRFAPPQGCDNPFVADFIARRSLRRAPLEDGSGEGWTWKFDPMLWTNFRMGDLGDLLPAMKAPTALIWGERSNLMTDEVVDYMLGRMPADVKTMVVPDADHHVMVDQPLAFVAALRGLLAGWSPS